MDQEKPAQEVDAFTAQLQRCLKYAIVAGVLGLIAGGCFTGGYFLVSEKPQYRNAMAPPFVTAGIGVWMVVGVTLLFSPAAVFVSPKGQECLRGIGVGTATGARIVIAILLLLGCAFIGLLSLGAVQMFQEITGPS